MNDTKIRYSKDALKFLSKLAWDPDFTKVTAEEAEKINHAEKSGFVNEDEIDWENIGTDE